MTAADVSEIPELRHLFVKFASERFARVAAQFLYQHDRDGELCSRAARYVGKTERALDDFFAAALRDFAGTVKNDARVARPKATAGRRGSFNYGALTIEDDE